jgi:hypothetical protein
LTLAILAVAILMLPQRGAAWTADDDYLRDREALEDLQRRAFNYMWEDGDPDSGLAYEADFGWEVRPSAIGGTGFGVAALVVATDRGWISRDQAVGRLLKIARLLRQIEADHPQWHGGFPHWLNSRTGEVFNFGDGDDIIDTVETALLMQGLLIARAYFNGPGSEAELREIITGLWQAVDWPFFCNSPKEQHGLFWHWSPQRGHLGLRIRGYNEALIAYVLAAGSPTHPISPKIGRYWRSGPDYQARPVYGYRLEAAPKDGGPLFLAHYSFIGLDPRLVADSQVPGGFFRRNLIQTLSNRGYCLQSAPEANQYSPKFWGLTAGQIKEGYVAASPGHDPGTVAPTGALSSLPYTPHYSMEVLHNLRQMMNGRAWGRFGPYDAVSLRDDWVSPHCLAIDQLPMVSMIENYRTGLLWRLLMSDPEVRAGLERMEFHRPKLDEGFPEAVVTLVKDRRAYVPDAYDLRRHPDTGQYEVPFWCRVAGPATLTIADPDGGPPLLERTVQAAEGRNFLAFAPFRRNDGLILTLTLQAPGGRKYHLPLRTH